MNVVLALELVGLGVELVERAADENDVEAALGKLLHVGLADAVRAAGDDRPRAIALQVERADAEKERADVVDQAHQRHHSPVAQHRHAEVFEEHAHARLVAQQR